MRRRFRRKPKKTVKIPQMRTNERIFTDPIFLIDHNGDHKGEIPTAEARALAESVGLDLVEVSPKANPPVCKILDYGKFQYNQTKQYKQNRSQQKQVDTKGVRIGLRTGEHDLDFKKKQAEKFLTKGNKVKIDVILRGREKAHMDLGRKNLENFLEIIKEARFKVEDAIKRSPEGFSVLIAPE